MDFASMALEEGFELAAELNTSQIARRAELQELCGPGLCPNYGTNWSCPPGAGAFDECDQRIAARQRGVLVQTVVHDVDTSDAAAMSAILVRHNARLDKLTARIRESCGSALEFTTGGCGLCEACTYPDAPCRNPSEQRLALSAHGVDLQQTCDAIGMEYSFEPSTIRYMGLVLA